MGSNVGADYLAVLVFGVVAVALALAVTGLSRLMAPRPDPKPRSDAHGDRAAVPGPSPRPSDSQWLSGVLGVVFAAQLALLYPWAIALDAAPMFVLVEMLAFLGIVGAGLLYALRGSGMR